MKDVNKNLEQFFHIDSTNETIKQEIVKPGASGPASEDYDFARQNLRNLISSGAVSLEGIMKVAIESDNPRAYEVLATMIKTIADINVNLMDVSTKFAETNKVTVKNNTNNSIFVGTTKDLQALLKKEKEYVEAEINESTQNRISVKPES